jgi:hypothetical protein
MCVYEGLKKAQGRPRASPRKAPDWLRPITPVERLQKPCLQLSVIKTNAIPWRLGSPPDRPGQVRVLMVTDSHERPLWIDVIENLFITSWNFALHAFFPPE